MEIIEAAYAKINLTLDITGKRADGYHEISSVMQSVSLCDTVNVKKSVAISVETDNASIPTGEKNIAYKAAALFKEKTSLLFGGEIYINKKIPDKAGLAGGSADAAAVLIAMNKLYDTNLSIDELCVIGVKCGADVPFCIKRGTALAKGIGEKLYPLKALPDCRIIIVKPQASVDTSKAYAQIDEAGVYKDDSSDALIKYLNDNNLKGIGNALSNGFESVITYAERDIIKNHLMSFGAYGACMSGSGSAVYGIFDKNSDYIKAYNEIKEIYGNVFVCSPV